MTETGATPAVLVLNAGSSSIKFALFEVDKGDPALAARGQIAGIGAEPRFFAHDRKGRALAAPAIERQARAIVKHEDALACLLDWLDGVGAGERLIAAGHRVVHGGLDRTAPELLDRARIAALAALVPLAPAHQGHNIAAIEALAQRRPTLPQVACFDTAFHARQPPLARRFALPRGLVEEKGLWRYGFHGLSYEYIAAAFPEITGEALPERLVVAHLGNGSSMCAIREGRSVATTMGFSTLDGLPMGTRSGAVDPGVLLYLMREEKMDEPALTALLYEQSGLLGVSGISGDMAALLASDDPRAAEAIALFTYSINRALGSLAAALGGLDGLVFTGGIGENAAPVRAAVCEAASWLGLAFDAEANAAGGPRISTPGSPVAAWVIPTDEELMVARHTLALIADHK